MHLIDGDDVLLDSEGAEMSAEAVANSAFHQARDCMAGDVRDGKLDLGYRINVHDSNGAVVHSLPFRDTLEIVRQ